MRENIILNAQINHKLFKTLILNFAYIHSKRWKLGIFLLFQKCQFVYPVEVSSPPIHQFSPFSSFSHMTCQVTISKR